MSLDTFYIHCNQNPELEKLIISLAISKGWKGGFCDREGTYEQEEAIRFQVEYYIAIDFLTKWIGWTGRDGVYVKKDLKQFISIHDAIRYIDNYEIPRKGE